MLCTVAMLCLACGGKSKVKIPIGSWELESAKQNNKPTELLNGAYFTVWNDSLQTNVASQETPMAFKVKDSTIFTDMEERFTVIEVNDSLMTLEILKHRNVFSLTLRRIQS